MRQSGAFIDVTEPQKDGKGAKDGNGNYIIAPDFSEFDSGFEKTFTSIDFKAEDGIKYADTYDGLGKYTMEYFIPFSALDNFDPIKRTVLGFDIVLFDGDITYSSNRAVWSNRGIIEENWNNMDFVGLLSLNTTQINTGSPIPKLTNKCVFKIYKQYITINTNFKEGRIANVTGDIQAFIGPNKSKFFTSELASGLYLITIIDEQGKMHTERFIKK